MSNSGKIIIAGLVVLIVALGYFLYPSSKGTTVDSNEKANDAMSIATTTKSNNTPAPLDTSDTSIQSDLDSVDSQINNLNTDYSNININ